jgi:hypothetical protein
MEWTDENDAYDQKVWMKVWLQGPGGAEFNASVVRTTPGQPDTVVSLGDDLAAGENTPLMDAVHIDAPAYRRTAGTAFVDVAGKVIRVDLHAMADARTLTGDICRVWATIT